MVVAEFADPLNLGENNLLVGLNIKVKKEYQMRLPETKIKEAILHPEKLVRQEALLYFAGCYSRDAEVMPLVIKAIQTYGRQEAFLQVYVLDHLVQTQATVEWAITELHRQEDKVDDHDSYFPTLCRLLLMRRTTTRCASCRRDSSGTRFSQKPGP